MNDKKSKWQVNSPLKGKKDLLNGQFWAELSLLLNSKRWFWELIAEQS